MGTGAHGGIPMTIAREWVEVRIPIAETSADAGELLGRLDAPAVAGAWQDEGGIRLYWPAQEWNPEVVVRLREVLTALGARDAVANLTVESVAAQDWNAAWARTVKPIRLGTRVVVRPPWESLEAASGTIDLVIEPKLAFGTGHHATTQMLVAWLEEEIRGGERVLDIGTGTGILAMVALRLGARYAEGWDHDPQAIEAAREYARENRFGEALGLREGTLDPSHPALDTGWHLVVANLDRGALVHMASQLGRLGRGGAVVLVSGLLVDQVEEIRSLYAEQELYVTARRDREGWVALRMEAAESCEHDSRAAF